MKELRSPVFPCFARSGWWDARSYRGGTHEGIDLVVPVGTPVWAAAGGEVIRVDAKANSFAGRWVAVAHEGGWISRYLHLSRVLTRLGRRVTAGDILGLSGKSGTGFSPPHLHFEMRLPPALVWKEYVRRFGIPVTGFGRLMGELGVAVPSEPVVPVDGYDEHVIARAREHAIPLHAAPGPPPGLAIAAAETTYKPSSLSIALPVIVGIVGGAAWLAKQLGPVLQRPEGQALRSLLMTL